MSREPIRWLDVAKMSSTPPPPVPWLARDVIPRSALTAVWAPGGLGKSLLSLSLATAVRHGEQLAGIDCVEGTTVYLDAENGEHEIHRRVHTLGLPASGVDVGDAGGLDLRRDFAALEETVSYHEPDLLVLDSFRSLHPGMDENDTAQTGAALDRLRRLAHNSGCALLLIHHANKGGRTFRGASTFRDGVDVLWELGRSEGDPDRQRRYLRNDKMRVAQDGARLWLRLSIDRGRVLVDQAEPYENDDTPAPAPVRAALTGACLAQMNGHPMRLADIARGVGRNPKDGSVRNALTVLERDGDIRKTPAGLWERCKGAEPLGALAPLHPCAHVVEGIGRVDEARADRLAADHSDLADLCMWHGRSTKLDAHGHSACAYCGGRVR